MKQPKNYKTQLLKQKSKFLVKNLVAQMLFKPKQQQQSILKINELRSKLMFL